MKEEKADMAEKKEEKEEETKDEDPPPPAEEWWKYKFLLFSVLEREILQGGGKVLLHLFVLQLLCQQCNKLQRIISVTVVCVQK